MLLSSRCVISLSGSVALAAAIAGTSTRERDCHPNPPQGSMGISSSAASDDNVDDIRKIICVAAMVSQTRRPLTNSSGKRLHETGDGEPGSARPRPSFPCSVELCDPAYDAFSGAAVLCQHSFGVQLHGPSRLGGIANRRRTYARGTRRGMDGAMLDNSTDAPAMTELMYTYDGDFERASAAKDAADKLAAQNRLHSACLRYSRLIEEDTPSARARSSWPAVALGVADGEQHEPAEEEVVVEEEEEEVMVEEEDEAEEEVAAEEEAAMAMEELEGGGDLHEDAVDRFVAGRSVAKFGRMGIDEFRARWAVVDAWLGGSPTEAERRWKTGFGPFIR